MCFLGSRLKGVNCMAVGERGELPQHFPPPVAVGGTPHRQFEPGFAAGSAPDGGASEPSTAEGVQLAFFQLAHSPLQQHAEVVGGNGQMMQRLRAPEVVHAQPFDPELPARCSTAALPARPSSSTGWCCFTTHLLLFHYFSVLICWSFCWRSLTVYKSPLMANSFT